MIIILVEVDLYNGLTSSIEVLRLSNYTYSAVRDMVWVEFFPSLVVPIELGTRISAEEFSQVQRGSPNGGNIEFVIDESIWPKLNYHWLGRKFRIYQGEEGWGFEDFSLIYSGRVSNFSFDVVSNLASISTTDASIDLDKVLVEDLYPDDEDTLEAIRSNPKPYLRGTVYSVEPILEDDVLGLYRLSFGIGLSEIMEIRVGGVGWDEYIGTGDPGPGQWKVDLAGGTFTLGSPTLGADVRCDVKAVGWETLTSAELIREIISSSGGEVDEELFDDFEILLPGLIGYYSIEPIHKLDVLDEIVFGCGAWWEFGNNGKIRIGVLKIPDQISDFDFSYIEIKSFELSNIILPVWRIKVEYRRNWQPLTTALSGVTDAEAEDMASDGILINKFEDEGIKILEPQAVDLPIIRSLFVNEEDAIEVRNRLAKAWGVESRVYNISCLSDSTPDLYSTLSIDFQMINGNFRVHSSTRSIGSKLISLQIWGSEGYDITEFLENEPESGSAVGYILSDFGDNIIINGAEATL